MSKVLNIRAKAIKLSCAGWADIGASDQPMAGTSQSRVIPTMWVLSRRSVEGYLRARGIRGWRGPRPTLGHQPICQCINGIEISTISQSGDDTGRNFG